MGDNIERYHGPEKADSKPSQQEKLERRREKLQKDLILIESSINDEDFSPAAVSIMRKRLDEAKMVHSMVSDQLKKFTATPDTVPNQKAVKSFKNLSKAITEVKEKPPKSDKYLNLYESKAKKVARRLGVNPKLLKGGVAGRKEFVRQLQRKMRKSLKIRLTADGDFGKNTADAIDAYLKLRAAKVQKEKDFASRQANKLRTQQAQISQRITSLMEAKGNSNDPDQKAEITRQIKAAQKNHDAIEAQISDLTDELVIY